MDKYDNDAIMEMCSRIDLLEYASQTLDFEKRGSGSWVCSCPLHIDITPSLFITPKLNQFYCQSCHVGGGPIQWLMTFEKMKFPDAVKKVSELAGIDIHNLKTCESLALFKSLRKSVSNKKIEVPDRIILPDDYMDQYLDETPQEWLDEGISAESMKRFGIHIDSSDQICIVKNVGLNY